ncbi:MAG: stage V sporulation protein AD [Bacilli bacterium]|nr:stage V sporulation protein AD [Bacilli bacterium]
MRKVGKNSVAFDNVFLHSWGTSCGPKEKEGPIGTYFDVSFNDLYCDEKTWETAEMNLMRTALVEAIRKGNLSISEVELAVGGDLNNQIAVSNYLMNDFPIPFIGIYGACSTAVLSLINASTFIDSGYGKYIACMTSSHNSTSERQFRYPTEYGGQRPPSITTTVTGSGVGILTNKKTEIRISKATIGCVTSSGENDANDMGRTMAPAASMTLKQHLEDFKISPDEYDLIVTGDLSLYGSKVFKDILKEYKIDVENNYQDCGLMIYDLQNQDVIAGGSGCGCASLVMYGYICSLLRSKKLKKVLVIATGALLNPVMVAQGKEIPSIAHAVCLEGVSE